MASKKYWTSTDEQRRLCNIWLQDPLVNPTTGHPIDRGGPTYQMLSEKCRELGLKHKPTATRQMTWRKCQEWRQNKSINPDTGNKIKIGGPTFKMVEKQCAEILEKTLQLHGDWFVPDTLGMIPAVLSHGTWYAIRKYNDRSVYGPLNKHAKNIRLVYYADTWDYRYNHFKPVFLGRTPSRPRSKSSRSDYSKNNPKQIVDNIVDLFVK